MSNTRLHRNLGDLDVDGDGSADHQRTLNSSRRRAASPRSLANDQHSFNFDGCAPSLSSQAVNTVLNRLHKPNTEFSRKQSWPATSSTVMSAAVKAAGRRLASTKEEPKKQRKSSRSVFEGWRNAGWVNGYIEDELDCLADFSKVLMAHRMASVTPCPAATSPAAGSIRKVSDMVEKAAVSDTTEGKATTARLSFSSRASERKSSAVTATGKAVPSSSPPPPPPRGWLLPQRCRHHKASLGMYDRELLETVVRYNTHLDERDLIPYTKTRSQKVVPISRSANEFDIVTYMEKMKNTNQNARSNDAMNSNQNAGGTDDETPGGGDGQGEGAAEAGLISRHSIKQESSAESTKMNEEGEDKEEDVKQEDVHTPRTLAKMVMAAKTRIRRCVAEDLMWSLKTVPTLDQLVIKRIAADFQDHPRKSSDIIPALFEKQLICGLSPSLPLPLVVDRVTDEEAHGNDYWRRRCEQTWPADSTLNQQVQERKHIKNLNDDEKGGCYKFRCLEQPVVSGSWKRLYFELRLTKLIENFVPRLSSFDELLQAVAIGGNYVRRLEIGQMLPPVFRASKMPRLQAPPPVRKPGILYPQDADEDDDASFLDEDDQPAKDHLNLNDLAKHLPCLNKLRITYGARRCGLNFDWNSFHVTLQDCARLAEFISGCPKLHCLEIHRCRLDDTRLLIICNGIRLHPSLCELRFPFNEISDDGARIIARHIDFTGPLIHTVDLTCNHIGSDGALALGYAISRSQTLHTLILRQNLIRDDGCAAICGALETANQTFRVLNLAANGLSSESAKSIGRLVAANTSLIEIDISCNNFGEDGGLCMMESIQFNDRLVKLDIRSTGSGIVNQHYIRIRLRDNRQRNYRLQRRHLYGRQKGDEQFDDELSVETDAGEDESVAASATSSDASLASAR